MENNPITEFQVLLVIKTADGRSHAYKSPSYKSTNTLKLDAGLINLVIARNLTNWIITLMEDSYGES